ncbi:hypothetical protein RRG08_058245 [Elysia crispata]|uniref:Endonuclease/exonuclease/phosphatase domain-containing protein n=1 Tax=Elysia crispata TaxID=231223 RepID=A0AAE0YWQ2_9GAST|nr:hypothetical protein RRG08_058245 [Elysia crispata]
MGEKERFGSKRREIPRPPTSRGDRRKIDEAGVKFVNSRQCDRIAICKCVPIPSYQDDRTANCKCVPISTNKDSITCLYTNADSLSNKRIELDTMIEIHRPAIIGIVEVKPKNSRFEIQECEIAIPGYDTFHNLDKSGRDVCLHIRTEMSPSLNNIATNLEAEECIFVDCTLQEEERLTIGLFYRSPNSTKENNDKINRTILASMSTNSPHLIIMGDFKGTSRSREYHEAAKVLKTTKEAYLIQHQMKTTRHKDGQKPTLDDLFFTNREDIVSSMGVTAALGKSDHATLLIKLALYQQDSATQKRPNYNKADYTAMNEYLSNIDWEAQLNNLNIEEAWQLFMAEINEVKRRYVPEKSTTGDRKKWLDGGTLSAVRKKHKMYRRWIETRDGQNYQEYAKARNKAARECRKAKIRLEKKVAEQAKRNPKSFWSYVKAKTSTRSGIGDLKRDDGTIASTDKEKAQVLNDFFQSVFTEEPDGELPKAPQFTFNSPLTNIDFKTEDIRKLLTKLKSGKAAGPDDIPTILLTETAEALALPISIIFRKSLDEGRVPNKNSTSGKHPLKNSKAEKDLGVIVDSQLNFKDHISQATTKANRILGVKRRSFDHLTDHTFVQLYKALVRPILEYGHSVWQPALETLQQDIEDVQCRAIKLIGHLKDKPYTAVNLETTEPGTPKTQRSRLAVRSNFFSERVVSGWNSLPESVLSAPSVNAFKNRLDSHWATHPAIYNPECYN